MTHRIRRSALVAAAVAAMGLALFPARAGAHAAIVSSEPEAGAELSSAPGAVTLRFTEPLIEELSGATVTDPDGRTFEGGPSAEREIRVQLATTAIGVYDVSWTTVSPLDGHTLRGTFRFGVGVSPGPGAEGATGVSPQRSDLLIAIGRAVEYAALLLAAGMLVVRRLARRPPTSPWARPRVAAAMGVALLAGVAVVSGEALTAVGSPSPAAVSSYLGTGLSGTARTVRLAAEALALVAALVGRMAWIPVGVAVAALAAAGHAAAVRPAWAGIAVDAIHLLSAGIWAGGIMALATVRPPRGWRSPEARALLDRFSPVAIAGFLLTVATGVARGWQELAGVADLVRTSYGLTLLAKVAGVLAMIPLSIMAWRRVRSPRLEAAVAVLVIGAAALLAAYPLPPGRATEAAEAGGPPREATALPRHGDLTMGDEAGDTLVGLTLRPARPGENDVLVYVLPLEGEEAAAGVATRISTGGTPARLEECGATCRRTTLDLEGGDAVAVGVEGQGGGLARFTLPDLPPPDAEAVLERMDRRMHDLESYRIREVFRPVEPPMRSTYAFEAPGRMHVRSSTGRESIVVGDTRWRRPGPEEPWERSEGPSLEVPSFIWDFGGDKVASRVLGTEEIDGRATTVVSFLQGTGVPIWFRLWIDEQSLVRRAEMRAQGHFMDHAYFGFDEPVDIEPPTEP